MFSVERNYLVAAFLMMSLLHSCGDGQPKTLPQSAFQVEFGKFRVPSEMRAGETVAAEIWLGNAGDHVWPSSADAKGRKQVNLSYHWLDGDRKIVILDGLRTNLPHDLKPGETLLLNVSIQAPPHAGRYVLQLSMVQEAVAWFHDKGGATLDLPVRVVEVGPPAPRAMPKRAAGVSSPNDFSGAVGAAASQTRQVRRLPSERAAGKASSAKMPRQVSRAEVWSVQVASGQQRAVIDRQVQTLRAKGFDAYVVEARLDGKTWYQARVGRFAGQAEAIELQSRVARMVEGGRSFVTNRQ